MAIIAEIWLKNRRKEKISKKQNGLISVDLEYILEPDIQNWSKG